MPESLTASRYGVITLHDENGVAGEFLASGMTAEEAERLWQIPGWQQHFEYLSRIPGPHCGWPTCWATSGPWGCRRWSHRWR